MISLPVLTAQRREQTLAAITLCYKTYYGLLNLPPADRMSEAEKTRYTIALNNFLSTAGVPGVRAAPFTLLEKRALVERLHRPDLLDSNRLVLDVVPSILPEDIWNHLKGVYTTGGEADPDRVRNKLIGLCVALFEDPDCPGALKAWREIFEDDEREIPESYIDPETRKWVDTITNWCIANARQEILNRLLPCLNRLVAHQAQEELAHLDGLPDEAAVTYLKEGIPCPYLAYWIVQQHFPRLPIWRSGSGRGDKIKGLKLELCKRAFEIDGEYKIDESFRSLRRLMSKSAWPQKTVHDVDPEYEGLAQADQEAVQRMVKRYTDTADAVRQAFLTQRLVLSDGFSSRKRKPSSRTMSDVLETVEWSTKRMKRYEGKIKKYQEQNRIPISEDRGSANVMRSWLKTLYMKAYEDKLERLAAGVMEQIEKLAKQYGDVEELGKLFDDVSPFVISYLAQKKLKKICRMFPLQNTMEVKALFDVAALDIETQESIRERNELIKASKAQFRAQLEKMAAFLQEAKKTSTGAAIVEDEEEEDVDAEDEEEVEDDDEGAGGNIVVLSDCEDDE